MRMNKLLYYGMCFVFVTMAAMAVELTGTTHVNVTSDTATQAKNKAFNSARREVILRELRQYANPEQLEAALKNSSNEDLMNIISSSSLDSEKISDTSYSANISFVIDGDAAHSWMEKYSVQNWLPVTNAVVVQQVDVADVNANLLHPISDWISLNAIARSVNVDIATKKMIGSSVFFAVPNKDISKFIGVLKSGGWNVQQDSGAYKIWK